MANASRIIKYGIELKITINIALPVSQSRACLTAITKAASPHKNTAIKIKKPIMGINPKRFKTCGEYANPKHLRSSPNAIRG